MGSVTAVAAAHTGEYCLYCHVKFSFESPNAANFSAPVKNMDVLTFTPCGGELCHSSNPERGAAVNRYFLHLDEAVCKNCHPPVKGESKFDIHRIHLKFESNRSPVDCSICHSLSDGYVSPLASVPKLKETYRTAGDYRILPWDGGCGYCHPSAKDSGRMHDVHSPVIKNICQECHGSDILVREDLISKVTGEQQKVETKEEYVVVQTFKRLLDDMEKRMLDLLSFILRSKV